MIIQAILLATLAHEPVFTSESAAAAPVIIQRCAPALPPGVRVAKRALFTHEIVVSSKGTVISVAFSDATRPYLPAVEQAVRNSLPCWHFAPAKFQGKPVAYRLHVTSVVPPN